MAGTSHAECLCLCKCECECECSEGHNEWGGPAMQAIEVYVLVRGLFSLYSSLSVPHNRFLPLRLTCTQSSGSCHMKFCNRHTHTHIHIESLQSVRHRMLKQIRLLIISALDLIEIIKFYEHAKSAQVAALSLSLTLSLPCCVSLSAVPKWLPDRHKEQSKCQQCDSETIRQTRKPKLTTSPK